MLAERTKKSGQLESAVVVPGSLVGCAAYLSSTKTRAVVTAAEPCKLVAFGPHELEKLLVCLALTSGCVTKPHGSLFGDATCQSPMLLRKRLHTRYFRLHPPH